MVAAVVCGPPVSHPAPVVQDHAWGLNWIDGFVMAKLEENELRPALDADRTTLIRRLSIDLTGLPDTLRSRRVPSG